MWPTGSLSEGWLDWSVVRNQVAWRGARAVNMAKNFDPYDEWLGIRPEEQPPNHYRLLGITLFEDDPDVIAAAAEARIVRVRSRQLGQHSEVSQRLLNEIAAASGCLLNQTKKTAYDRQLRARLTSQLTPLSPAFPDFVTVSALWSPSEGARCAG